MTEPSKATNPSTPTEPTTPSPASGGALEAYFRANQATATEEALSAAARASGHSDEAIEAAWARLRRNEAAAPARALGRRIVLGLYALTFLTLVAGMIINSGSSAGIGTGILLVTMLIGLAVSLFMVRRAGPEAAMAIILAGPVIILLIVAGLCVASGLPLRPATV